MRSRYCAYARGDLGYLLRTWHSSSRPSRLSLERSVQPNWLGLKVLDIRAGGEGDREGWVTFVAEYQMDDRHGSLHENSHFVREEGVGWFYIGGEFPDQPAAMREVPSRNAPCPCGSGKKYKRCCGR